MNIKKINCSDSKRPIRRYEMKKRNEVKTYNSLQYNSWKSYLLIEIKITGNYLARVFKVAAKIYLTNLTISIQRFLNEPAVLSWLICSVTKCVTRKTIKIYINIKKCKKIKSSKPTSSKIPIQNQTTIKNWFPVCLESAPLNHPVVILTQQQNLRI